ncbi:hypothetical protein MES5069_510056 [Mesorhizobium escarrei]|uniref:Uncharacterized protein n=1 Tax=Mesorhizobium escarrei TaxID=666018 RepID=A0ABN8KBV4_9HYPH|nr:hypothetical protein MES5069_510056 [Mesorhizobium escarrei]
MGQSAPTQITFKVDARIAFFTDDEIGCIAERLDQENAGRPPVAQGFSDQAASFAT